MDNHALSSFIANIKKNEKPLKGLGIKPTGWGKFQVTKKNNGTLNLSNIVNLYEWAKGVLQSSAQEFEFLIDYHPKSPKYWLNDIDEKDEDGNYSVRIDLETFMDSKSSKKHMKRNLGYVIPDNYELAKNVMNEFNKKFKKRHGLQDTSFRDLAVWKSKNPDETKALASFLEKKYVSPTVKLVMKRNKIKEAVFTKDTVDFK